MSQKQYKEIEYIQERLADVAIIFIEGLQILALIPTACCLGIVILADGLDRIKEKAISFKRQ